MQASSAPNQHYQPSMMWYFHNQLSKIKMNNLSAGGAGGAMDTGDWRTQLAPDFRQRIINNIVEFLKRRLTVNEQEETRGLMRIAAAFEENMYNAATSLRDYLLKFPPRMLMMERSQNPMTNSLHPNASSSGQNDLGTEAATSYETISGPEETDKEDEEEGDGDVSKEKDLEEVVVTAEQKSAVQPKENVKVGEYEISDGLNSDAKLDERLAQVEERLEKIEAHSEKMESFLVDINKKLNYLVKTQDAKVSRDIRRLAKCMSSSWSSGNVRAKRKNRVAEMIRESCKHRRLARGDKTITHPVAMQDDSAKND